MKTLQNTNIKTAASMSKKVEDKPRPRIGDDDGISDRLMNIVIMLFTALTIVVSIGSSIAQDSVKYRVLLRQAMLDMDRLEYESALIKLLEVRANVSENANVNYMIGLCYMYGYGAAEQAVFYLSLATPYVSHTYQEWDLDEIHAPPVATYYLASAHEQLENYAQAADYYTEFIDYSNNGTKPNTSRTYALISKRAEDCRLAANNTENSFENMALKNK